MTLIPASTEISCPACGAADLLDFFQVERIPIDVGVLWDCPAEARRAPMGTITLSWCRGCGFIHNRTFEPAQVTFEPGYEVALTHSETFRSFMENLALRLIERFSIRHKTVIEIGCGEAYFLRQLCRLGPNDGIGIDPTVRREGIEEIAGKRIRFIRDLYSERYADLEGDFVCCLSVFEDIPRPVEFLKIVRAMIGERDVPVYLEVFNGVRALEARETWSVHYEQCNYFSAETLCAIFRSSGFDVTDSGPCYGADEYLYVEAVPRRSPDRVGASGSAATAGRPQVPRELSEFGEIHAKSLDTWKTRFESYRKTRRRVVVWGSGGKGISFLNSSGADDIIRYVVDINPARQGRYVPGSAQRIVAPESLIEYRPQTVIISNPFYEQEIRKQISKLGVTCEFLHA